MTLTKTRRNVLTLALGAIVLTGFFSESASAQSRRLVDERRAVDKAVSGVMQSGIMDEPNVRLLDEIVDKSKLVDRKKLHEIRSARKVSGAKRAPKGQIVMP